MTYDEFVEKTAKVPIFGEDLFNTFGWSKGAMHLQLSRWTKAGKLMRLKRGLYCLPAERSKAFFSTRWLANTMYSPSYISLEYVLSWYDLIPEAVHAVTSVSRLKTAVFKNPLGRFTYRHLRKDLFFGFEEAKDEFQKKVLMAHKEKALLDFVYLHKGWEASRQFLEEGIRLQQVDQLSKKRLKEYAIRFRSKRISDTVAVLLKMI